LNALRAEIRRLRGATQRGWASSDFRRAAAGDVTRRVGDELLSTVPSLAHGRRRVRAGGTHLPSRGLARRSQRSTCCPCLRPRPTWPRLGRRRRWRRGVDRSGNVVDRRAESTRSPSLKGAFMATTDEQTTTDLQTRYADASNKRVTAENAIEYAYRDLGAGVPLVLLQHFRGNLDNWDPALIDDLAAERRVVTFDNVGVGGTTGETPNTVEAMAHDAIAFVEAMGLEKADLLGFSIGSFVAQEIALIRPDLLRRVVLASSAPQGAAGMHGWAPEVIGAVGAPETSPEGYLSVFFAPTKTSLEAGQEAAGRIFGGRTTDRDEPTTWQTRQAQYDA